MNVDRSLGIEEKRLLNSYDSSLYGFIKPTERGYEFHQLLLYMGIEHYEGVLLWKKNMKDIDELSSLNLSILKELNAIEESIIFCKLGHLHLLLEQYPQALSAYQRYYSLEPLHWKDPLFLYGLGLVYFHFGAFDLALDAFYRTLYVDPNFARANEIHLRLGTVYKIRGNLRFSVKHFQLALVDECNPLSISRAHIHFQVAHLFESRGHFALGRRLYELLLKQGPNPQLPSQTAGPANPVDPYVRANALRQVGWICHNHPDYFRTQGPGPDAPRGKGSNAAVPHTHDAPPPLPSRDNAAIHFLQSAISIDPGSGQTWYYLGRCFANLGKIHDAFISYRHSIDKSEGSADTWCSIGVLYQQQNQPMDALQAYICAIQLNKKFTPAWTNLALLYETCNMPRDALTCYANAIRAGDPNPALLPRIKKLKESVISGDVQSYHPYKKQPLPTVEEAWNLPIPAELTSRQNADSKIPPFMTKYIYPLLQQQRELRGKLAAFMNDKRHLAAANMNNGFYRNVASNGGQPMNCSTFLSPTAGSGNNQNSESPMTKRKAVNETTDPQNSLFDGLEMADVFNAEDEDDDEDFMDPAVERELESLLAMDGADPNTLFASLAVGTGSPSSLLGMTSCLSPSLLPSSSNTPLTPNNPNQAMAHTPTNGYNPSSNCMFTPPGPHQLLPEHQRPDPKPLVLVDFYTPTFLDIKVDPLDTHKSSSTCHRHLYYDEPYSQSSNQSIEQSPKKPSFKTKLVENLDVTVSALRMSSADIIRMCRNEAIKNIDSALSNGPPPIPPIHPNPPDHNYLVPRPVPKTSATALNPKDCTTPGPGPGSLAAKSRGQAPSHAPTATTGTPTATLTVPVISIGGKKQVHSQELKNFCYLNPVVIIRGLCQTLKLDLSLYSTKTLVMTHPNHEIEVRSQARFPLDRNYADVRTGRVQTWRCSSTRHHMPLIRYAKYQGTSFKRALEEEKAHPQNIVPSREVDPVAHEEEAKKIKDTPPFKKILFGTNVDLSDDIKWKDQLLELSKLPAFLKVSSPSNILSHIGHTVLGMNSVQLYMKVPGCRTPGHRENLNFCSVNINIGPGDTEWFAVPDMYWGAFSEICRSRRVDFLKGSWWPDIRELQDANIPVYRFTQKPGDVVWVNTGTIHWVQASGWCNNIAWNVGPMTAHQYESALGHYDWNKLQQYKSLVPMVHLSWNLVRNLKIAERPFYELLKTALFKSLKRCQLLMEFLEGIDKKIVWHGVSTNEPAYYCDKCEVEVFNLLFVKEEDKKNVVHCFECARRMNPTLGDFVVLQQYEMAALYQTYDDFKFSSNQTTSSLTSADYHQKVGLPSTSSYTGGTHGLLKQACGAVPTNLMPPPPVPKLGGAHKSSSHQSSSTAYHHTSQSSLPHGSNVVTKRSRSSTHNNTSGSSGGHTAKKSRATKSSTVAPVTSNAPVLATQLKHPTHRPSPATSNVNTINATTTSSHQEEINAAPDIEGQAHLQPSTTSGNLQQPPSCTIPPHTLMRTPAGLWVKKERMSGASGTGSQQNSPNPTPP